MRVMCIKKESWITSNGDRVPKSDPSYGEIVLVVGNDEYNNELFYQLAGYEAMYRAASFIPLSNIDELELIEQRQLQNA